MSQTTQPKTSLSKEEIIAALRKCAEKLVVSQFEFAGAGGRSRDMAG